MAQTSYPFDGVTVSESQFSAFFKELQDTGVAGSADSTALKVTGDGGGMRVFVAAGSAIVRGFFYNNDASVQLTIGASTSLVRYDRIVLRLDPSVNSAVLAVVAGTPGAASPAALTQTTTGIYELPLAVVTVGASVANIGSGVVVDDRIFHGHRVGVWSTAKRPASPRQYQPGFNTSLGYFEHWNGTTWVQSSATAGHTHAEPTARLSNPKAIQSGREAFTAVSGGNSVTKTVTFATPFDATPNVVAAVEAAGMGADLAGITVAQTYPGGGVTCNITLRAKTTWSSGWTGYITWIAIDPAKLV